MSEGAAHSPPWVQSQSDDDIPVPGASDRYDQPIPRAEQRIRPRAAYLGDIAEEDSQSQRSAYGSNESQSRSTPPHSPPRILGNRDPADKDTSQEALHDELSEKGEVSESSSSESGSFSSRSQEAAEGTNGLHAPAPEPIVRSRREVEDMFSPPTVPSFRSGRHTSSPPSPRQNYYDYLSDWSSDSRSPSPPYPGKSPIVYGGSNRAPFHGYEAPKGWDPETQEDFALSYNCPVGGKIAKFPSIIREDGQRPGNFHHHWHTRRLNTRPGFHTELLAINAAESLADEKNNTSITLYCAKDILDAKPAPPSRQLHWLHVTYSGDVMKVIRSLIIACPFVRNEVRSLALNVLDKIFPDTQVALPRRETWQGVQGAVRRIDGVYRDNPLASDSVVFYSTPWLALEQPQHTNNRDSMDTLLNYLFGYDVGPDQVHKQVLPKTEKSFGNGIVHVAHLGCLLLGSEVVLTWGEMSMSTLMGDNIFVDDNSSFPPTMLRIEDDRGMEYYSYIKHDMTFAELLGRITSITGLSDFKIYHQQGLRLLKPEEWLPQLGAAFLELKDVDLKVVERQKKRARSDSVQSPPRYRDRQRTGYSMTFPPGTFAGGERVTKPSPASKRKHERRPGIYFTRHLEADFARNVRQQLEPYPKERPGSSEVEVGLIALPTAGKAAMMQRPEATQPPGSKPDESTALVLRPRRYDQRASALSDPEYTKASSLALVKVVNDVALRSQTDRNYWPTSTDDDSDASSRSRANPARGEHPESGKEIAQQSKARLEAWDRATQACEQAVEDYKLIVTPFLTWGIAQRDSEAQKPDKSLTACVRLLRKLDKSLADGSLYLEGYRCTLTDLIARHEMLQADFPVSQGGDQNTAFVATTPDHHPLVDPESSFMAEPVQESVHDEVLLEGVPGSGASKEPSSHASDKISTPLLDIFKLSRSIMSFFVPLQTHAVGDVEWVIDRYWGALDQIFRLVQHVATRGHVSGNQGWTIRQSPCGHQTTSQPQDVGQPGSKCETCGRGAGYSFEAALERLHSGQRKTSCGLPSRPFEDSCIVWLRSPKSGTVESLLLSKLLVGLEVFRDDLEELRTELWGLHQFFVKPGPLDQNDGNHLPNTRNLASEPPALPISLLKSFKLIIVLFISQAQVILQLVRENEDHQIAQGVMRKSRERYRTIRRRVSEHVQKAQEALVLNITDQSNGVVRLGAVGIELIAIVAMMNIQNGSLWIKPNTVSASKNAGSIANGSSKSVATWPWGRDLEKMGGQGPHDATTSRPASVDIMNLYAAYLSKLTFKASVNPQRKLVMEIRQLGKEPAALYRVNDLQMNNMFNTQKILDPDSCRITNQERKGQFSLENNALQHGIKRRTAVCEEVNKLQGLTEDLVAQVKSDIEVLDEGHGNAIRVSTLVTLFFLPLSVNISAQSFISSFFGMNTVDIRDTSSGQWLYWSIAVPVTLTVLVSAYLYAYKGNAPAYWVQAMFGRRRRRLSKVWPHGDASYVNPARTRQGQKDTGTWDSMRGT